MDVALRAISPLDIARLHAAAGRVLSRYPEVIAAYLYGSAARGGPSRDIDVGVVIDRGAVSPFRLDRMASELQSEAAPERPDVDLRPLAGANPRFRATVVREGTLLYELDAATRRDFEVTALSEWLDFRPTWERLREAFLARWRRG